MKSAKGAIPWPECDQFQGTRERKREIGFSYSLLPEFLSIDLLYDFKKVQPMPNHPAIFSLLVKKGQGNPPSFFFLLPYSTSRLLRQIAMREARKFANFAQKALASSYILLSIYLRYQLRYMMQT